jgi:hypothetical protein
VIIGSKEETGESREYFLEFLELLCDFFKDGIVRLRGIDQNGVL